MAAATGTGYVTTWNSQQITGGASTRKPTSFTDTGQVAKPRIITLGSGVKVNYDGSGNSPVVETRVSQEFFDTAGVGFIHTMSTKLGQQGTLRIENADGGVYSENDMAVLISVKDSTPIAGARARAWGTCTWEILGAWTNGVIV